MGSYYFSGEDAILCSLNYPNPISLGGLFGDSDFLYRNLFEIYLLDGTSGSTNNGFFDIFKYSFLGIDIIYADELRTIALLYRFIRCISVSPTMVTALTIVELYFFGENSVWLLAYGYVSDS